MTLTSSLLQNAAALPRTRNHDGSQQFDELIQSEIRAAKSLQQETQGLSYGAALRIVTHADFFHLIRREPLG